MPCISYTCHVCVWLWLTPLVCAVVCVYTPVCVCPCVCTAGEGHAKPRERQRMGHVTISLQMVPRTSPSRWGCHSNVTWRLNSWQWCPSLLHRCLSDVSLFYQPGKPGFYAPRAGGGSPERLNAYRNVGRMMGLALLHTEVMPLPLCRHIFKYILGREVRVSPWLGPGCLIPLPSFVLLVAHQWGESL